MAINKVTQNDNTLIDLTNDTATAVDVLSGVTFHLANGEQATGTRPATQAYVATATTSSSRVKSISFSVSKEPASWALYTTGSVTGTSNYPSVCSIQFRSSENTVDTRIVQGNAVTGVNNVGYEYSSGTFTITIPSSVTAYFPASTEYQLTYIA